MSTLSLGSWSKMCEIWPSLSISLQSNHTTAESNWHGISGKKATTHGFPLLSFSASKPLEETPHRYW